MVYVCRHSYFLCSFQFVFRRSPARLAVKKYAHAKREEDFFTCNQPIGPPCGTGLKNNFLCPRNEDGFRSVPYIRPDYMFMVFRCCPYVYRTLRKRIVRDGCPACAFFVFRSGMGIPRLQGQGAGCAATPLHMQCRGSRRAFPAAGKKADSFMFHGGFRHERGVGTDIFFCRTCTTSVAVFAF